MKLNSNGKIFKEREKGKKDTLVHSVCVLSPVSDVFPPADILLTSVRTPLWGTHRISDEWQIQCFNIYLSTNINRASVVPLQRRTISCLAPMVPSMASSRRAFMSWDFLKVRLLILSRVFFPWEKTQWTGWSKHVSIKNENLQYKVDISVVEQKITFQNKDIFVKRTMSYL